MMVSYLNTAELEPGKMYHCEMYAGEKVLLRYEGNLLFVYVSGPCVLQDRKLSLEGDVRYAFKEAVLEHYFAFEIGDETGYVIGVDTDEVNFDARCNCAAALLEDADTYALGSVDAYSVDDAVTKIRLGHWEYSQKC